MTRKNFARDILVCITRYYKAIEKLENWLASGGRVGELPTMITLEGDSNMPKHPILDFNKSEKQIFIQCFGDPLLSPKDFAHVSCRDYMNLMAERRDFMRDVIAMTKHSRYIGLYPPKPRRRK